MNFNEVYGLHKIVSKICQTCCWSICTHESSIWYTVLHLLPSCITTTEHSTVSHTLRSYLQQNRWTYHWTAWFGFECSNLPRCINTSSKHLIDKCNKQTACHAQFKKILKWQWARYQNALHVQEQDKIAICSTLWWTDQKRFSTWNFQVHKIKISLQFEDYITKLWHICSEILSLLTSPIWTQNSDCHLIQHCNWRVHQQLGRLR